MNRQVTPELLYNTHTLHKSDINWNQCLYSLIALNVIDWHNFTLNILESTHVYTKRESIIRFIDQMFWLPNNPSYNQHINLFSVPV